MTRALVIGYGSIGQRHARILGELGCDVAVVSRRAVDGIAAYGALAPALAGHRPEYVVIASRTSEHSDDLDALISAGFAGKVLVEKPLFHAPGAVPQHGFAAAAVAYNLRFHPIFERLCTALEGERVLSLHGFVGQYLPDWRPGTDYRQSYSARAEEGGGVLLDLSHDIDLLGVIGGRWQALAALGGHLSKLEITSDDAFSLLIRYRDCPMATLVLNYLDRGGRREIIAQCEDATYRADFIAGVLSRNGTAIATVTTERDLTYRSMHQAMLVGRMDVLCTFEEGAAVLDVIAAARRGAAEKDWIFNV